MMIVAALLEVGAPAKIHPINDPIVVASGIKAAAPHDVASHNFAWQTPNPRRKRRDKNWQI
jgi:hypothetical protein